jgi:D,D-heptose 1,7-bisphosphate phosphatase
MALSPAVFLDKDGTILLDLPYNANPDLMCFAPGAVAGLSRLGTLGLPLIIISNQAGIGLGRLTQADLLIARRRLESMFSGAGARLDGFYYCPHHPLAVRRRYRKVCACRKPAPGLLRAAARRLEIDLGRSWFVGDILDDVEAGRRAGCRTILLDNGNETEWRINAWRVPDRIESNLDDASRWISAHHPSGGERAA